LRMLHNSPGKVERLFERQKTNRASRDKQTGSYWQSFNASSIMSLKT
jgi:hypothetical protein